MTHVEVLDQAWQRLAPGIIVRATLWALYEGKIDGGISLRSVTSKRALWAPHKVTESVSRVPSATASTVILRAEIADLDRSGDGWTLGLISRSADLPVIWIPDEMLLGIEPLEN